MECIDDFNSTFLFMLTDIAAVCPKSIIGTNIKEIERIIKNKDNHTLFIDLFVSRVLKYKAKLRERDETFFYEKTYVDDLEGYSFLMNKVLEFKNIWNDLKRENKDIVMDYMNILCDLAEQYFLAAYNK